MMLSKMIPIEILVLQHTVDLYLEPFWHNTHLLQTYGRAAGSRCKSDVSTKSKLMCLSKRHVSVFRDLRNGDRDAATLRSFGCKAGRN